MLRAWALIQMLSYLTHYFLKKWKHREHWKPTSEVRDMFMINKLRDILERNLRVAMILLARGKISYDL